MKYKVMECHLSYAVVLSEDGRFLKAANLNYTVGETVTDVVEMRQLEEARQPEEKIIKRVRRKWAASLTAAVCLMAVLPFSFQVKQTPYGSVYMEINPSVRIDVNQKDTVIGLRGTNQDGEHLVKNYVYKKKELAFVMEELVDRAIDMGFLQEGGEIVLTLDGESEQWTASHESTLSDGLSHHLEGDFRVTITVNSKTEQSIEVSDPIVVEIPVSGADGKDSLTETQALEGRTPETQAPEQQMPVPEMSNASAEKESDYQDRDEDGKENEDGEEGDDNEDDSIEEAPDTDYEDEDEENEEN